VLDSEAQTMMRSAKPCEARLAKGEGQVYRGSAHAKMEEAIRVHGAIPRAEQNLTTQNRQL
jgi:hypothetical protein